MALHFELDEFESRKTRVIEEMARRRLDALLLFAPESHYWLTGYDTFGYCFFQCLVLTRAGEFTLMTRSPDIRQARHTSIIENVVVWTDQPKASHGTELRELLNDLDLLGSRIGVEYDTPGLTAANGRAVDDGLKSFGTIEDASDLVPALRAVKSEAELVYVRRAAELADEALDVALSLIKPGADDATVRAAMQAAVLAKGGDYPGNPFIVNSGRDALLCRSMSGSRVLEEQDQITLEFAGVYRMYHAALMRTVIVGEATARHVELHAAAAEALSACEEVMRPGNTFGDVFAAHARVMEERNLTRHRLNACGYSLGAKYPPAWMDPPMFFRDNAVEIVPGMVLFAHMILMDSETETAMTLGRTYLTTGEAPEPLSRHGTALLER